GAVRADQRVDGPAPHLERHVLDGDEPLELLGEPACFENGIVQPEAASSLPARKLSWVMASRPRVAVIGGGIGGLFAANALIAHGVQVSVYEQASALG